MIIYYWIIGICGKMQEYIAIVCYMLFFGLAYLLSLVKAVILNICNYRMVLKKKAATEFTFNDSRKTTLLP